MAIGYPLRASDARRLGPAAESTLTATGTRAPSLFDRLRSAVSGPVAPAWRHVPITALVLMMVAVGLQPVLPEEEQAISAAEAVAGWGVIAFVFMSYFGCALLTARGSRAGLVLSLPATLLMLIIVVTCPVSGHHGWGNWVVGSFGAAFVAAGLHGASLLANRQR
jgi:hypothetical protein